MQKRELKRKSFAAIMTSVGLLLTGAAATAQSAKPTIVLVHGAFADSSSWYGVIAILEKDGYPVIAAANPLRSVKGDADTVRALVASLNTPVVLVERGDGVVIRNNRIRQGIGVQLGTGPTGPGGARVLDNEILENSMILGDNAYDVVQGWTGLPVGSFDEHFASAARTIRSE